MKSEIKQNKSYNNYSVLVYIMNGITFVLLTASLAHSIFVSLFFPLSVWYTLAITAILYIVLSIYLFNGWTIAILLPVTLFAIRLYTLFLPDKWWEQLYPWFEWMALYPLGLTSFKQEFLYPSALLTITLLSIIFYVLVIKLKWFITPLVTGVVILGTEWFLGHSQISPFIWLFAFAMVLLLGGKHHQTLKKDANFPDYGMWQISALPLALAVILTSIIIVPSDTSMLKWEFLEDKVKDLNDALSNNYAFTEPRQPFRLSQTGFSSSSDSLGGPVKLSNDVVLEVISPTNIYLRGTVLNHYTGSAWVDSIDDKRYRFHDIYWNSVKSTAFSLDEPVWEDLEEPQLRRFFPSIEVNVTHKGIETSVIFNALQCIDILTKNVNSYTPYFNGKGESFTSRYIGEHEPYTLKVRVPAIESDEFQRYLRYYVPSFDMNRELSIQPEEEISYYKKLLEIQQNYTKIPDTLPKRVIELARKITINDSSPIDKALSIQKYLETNYTYTLNPPYTPENQDFVDYFLFELEEGYCTYFATAMAIMGRAIGLPTRYIEGFSMPNHPGDMNVYHVRKRNSHAWVEVYFPKVGWLPFDPTPTNDSIHTVHDNYTGQTSYDPYLDEYMEDYMQDQSQFTLADLDPAAGQSGSKTWWQKSSHLLITLSVIILFLAVLTVSVLTWYKLRWLSVRKRPLKQQLHAYYTEIMWLLTLYGFPLKPGETPYAYAERVDTWLINNAGSMYDISHMIVKSEFSSARLTNEDIENIKAFYLDLEGSVIKLLGLFRYLVELLSRKFSNINKVKAG